MIPADFRSLLLAQASIVALAGSRIYPLIIPPEVWDSVSTKPCIVYSINGVGRNLTFCGTEKLQRESVSVDSYSRTYDEAVSIASAIKTIIDFQGTIGSTYFNAVHLDTEIDLLDPEPGLYRRAMTFSIWNRSI